MASSHVCSFQCSALSENTHLRESTKVTHSHLVTTTKCTLKSLAVPFSNTPWCFQLILLAFNLETIDVMETDQRVRKSNYFFFPSYTKVPLSRLVLMMTTIPHLEYERREIKNLKAQPLQLWVSALLSFCLVTGGKVGSLRNTRETWHQLADQRQKPIARLLASGFPQLASNHLTLVFSLPRKYLTAAPLLVCSLDYSCIHHIALPIL